MWEWQSARPAAINAAPAGDRPRFHEMQQGPRTETPCAFLGKRDQLLHKGANFFRFFHRCDDPLVLEQGARQVALQRQAVRSVSTQLSTGSQVSHGSESLLVGCYRLTEAGNFIPRNR